MNEPPENEWELGSDKEMHDAVHGSRKQAMTRTRFGEYLGGTVGLLLGVAVSLIHFFTIQWPDPNPRSLLFLYGAMCIGGLFGGAAVGKKLLASAKAK